jgi:hypothetical protein
MLISLDLTFPRHQNPTPHLSWYYSLLPKSFPSCPLFWSDDDLYLLLGTYLLFQIEERKANIARDYSEVVKYCSEFSSLCSLEEFTLLRMLIASRNFSIEVNGTTVTLRIIQL